MRQQRGALAAVAGSEQVGHDVHSDPAVRGHGPRSRPVVVTAEAVGVAVVPDCSSRDSSATRILPYSSLWGIETRRTSAAALLVLTDRSGWQLSIRLPAWGQGEGLRQFLSVVRSRAQVADGAAPEWSRWAIG